MLKTSCYVFPWRRTLIKESEGYRLYFSTGMKDMLIIKDCRVLLKILIIMFVHRDSERQLHFDTKFEHEEIVLVA